MRITGGQYRGRILQAPKGDVVRPTSDRTRQAIFNILTAGRWRSEGDPDLADANIMDVFCGTGALGLEALSRGAAACVFVDVDKTSLSCARANAETLKQSEHAHFILRDAGKIGPRPAAISQAAFVFLDPPYRKNLVASALNALIDGDWLGHQSVIVVETENNPLEDLAALPFDCVDTRPYGDTLVRILRST